MPYLISPIQIRKMAPRIGNGSEVRSEIPPRTILRAPPLGGDGRRAAPESFLEGQTRRRHRPGPCSVLLLLLLLLLLLQYSQA